MMFIQQKQIYEKVIQNIEYKTKSRVYIIVVILRSDSILFQVVRFDKLLKVIVYGNLINCSEVTKLALPEATIQKHLILLSTMSSY